MTHKIIFTALAILAYTFGANAETCTTTTTSTPAGPLPTYARPFIQNCTSISYTNYYANGSSDSVYSTPQCSSCSRGYYKFTFYNTGATQTDWTSTCEDYNPSFTICAKPCDSLCVDNDEFESDGNGVESLTVPVCIYGDTICRYDNYYRCESGYYGLATADGNGCEPCPPNTDQHYPVKSNVSEWGDETTYIQDCYFPANDSHYPLKDATGRFLCQSNAYYKN